MAEEKQNDELAPHYIEMQEQIKKLMVEYGEGIFENIKGDKDIDEQGVRVAESMLGTLCAGIKEWSWDRIARDIKGGSVFLVKKYDIKDDESEEGFKFILEGINSDYKEAFKSRAERERAIIEGGMVIYNG